MEIRFLANIIDQLDFALDHIALADVNYKRLALMLIDNAMELGLHRHAEGSRLPEWQQEKQSPEQRKALADALGQRFEKKVRFARVTNLLSDEVAQSVAILHSYRNQLYHQGVMHERILHALTVFYFRIVCDVMAAIPMHGYSWSSGDRVPHRAVKYIGKRPSGDILRLLPQVWSRLKEVSETLAFDLVKDLQAEMEAMADETERLLDFLVEADPEKRTRDEHVVDSQAWHMAFTDEGKRYAAEHLCQEEIVSRYVKWFAENYKFEFRRDPVPAWRTRAASLGEKHSLHLALKKYQDFVDQTEYVRDSIESSAALLDREIDRQVDAARERRHQ